MFEKLPYLCTPLLKNLKLKMEIIKDTSKPSLRFELYTRTMGENNRWLSTVPLDIGKRFGIKNIVGTVPNVSSNAP